MECPKIPEIDCDEFAKRLVLWEKDREIPLVGTFELTARCNLRCRHCYINVPANDKPASEKELTTSQWHRLIDEVSEAGCLWLLLTGGEVFIRPDFLDIYKYTVSKGLLVTIFTNGTCITPQIADELGQWPPSAVEITLYGVTEATHDAVTGVPGSHRRCMRGIKLLQERGLPVKLKSVMMKLNRHEFLDLKRYSESLGLKFLFDANLNMRIDGGKGPAAYRLSPEETVELDLMYAECAADWKDAFRRDMGVPVDSGLLYKCGAGLRSFYVDPYGKLGLCVLVRSPQYDLLQGTFSDGWREFIPSVRRTPQTFKTECDACNLRNLCGHCPGWAQLESGDPEKPVTYQCRITQLRRAVFTEPEWAGSEGRVQ